MLSLIRLTVVTACFLSAAPMVAQVGAPQVEDLDELQLQVDRDTTLAFGQFRRAIANRKWSDARTQLERLWTADPNVMVEDRGRSGVYIPLYLAVHRAADAMLQGPAADVMPMSDPNRLRVKLGASSIGDFPDLALQTAGTPSAGLPFVLLARTQESRGHAALGQKTLRQIAPNAARLAGVVLSDLPPGETEDTKTTRTEDASLEIPNYTTWDQRIPTSQQLRSRLQRTLSALLNQPDSAINTTWRATVDSGAVFVRTLSGFARHDSATGAKQWEYPIEDGLMAAMRVGSVATAGNPFLRGQPPELNSRASDLILRDRLVAQSVTDSRHVYLVVAEDLVQHRSSMSLFGRQPTATSNRLVALQKETGTRVWSFGISTLKSVLGPSASGGWVMGPPLVSGRQLFVVVEWNGELRLCCVESESGQLNWSTVLSFPEQTIDRDPYRRELGLTPVEKNGVIYTLTGSGWLCSVDSLSHGMQFASRVRKDQVQETSVPRIRQRGRVIRLTNRLPIGQCWNEAGLRFVGEHLAVMADQRHALAIVDPETGALRSHRKVSAGEFVLATNESGLLLGNADQIRYVSVDDGQTLWKVEIVADERPSGTGVIKSGRFLYPSINGSIIVRQMDSGKFLKRSQPILPVDTWGRLQTLDGDDLLYDAPTRHIRLSADLNTQPSPDPMDLANRSIRERDWASAIDVLSDALDQDPGPGLKQELKDALFSCRLQMSLASAEVDQSFDQQNLSESQQLIVDILKLKFAVDQKQSDVVRQQIPKLLNRSPRELSQPIPEIGSDVKVTGLNGVRVQSSLLAFGTDALVKYLQASDDPESELKTMGPLNDDTLLHLYHPAALPEIAQRVSELPVGEAALQLVLHSIALRSLAEADFDFEAQWFADRLADGEPEAGIDRAKWLLLRAVLAEQPQAFQQAVATKADVESLEEIEQRFQGRRRQNYGQWNAEQYVATPVRAFPNTAVRQSKLFPTVVSDPFLREYHLRSTAADVGRIVLQNQVDPDDRFTFTARLEAGSVYTTVANVVGRIGSVLLVRSFRNLSAISLLDQRQIWGKRSTRSLSFSRRRSNFMNYDSAKTPHPMVASTATWRIVGTGSRWFALLQGTDFQMIDSLTGQSLWKIEFTKTPSNIVATEDYVLVQQATPSSKPLCFDRQTGAPIEIDFDSQLLSKVIRNVGNEFVVWKDSGPDQPPAVQWLVPGETQPSETVELAGYSHFQFFGEETLVGFGPQGKFSVLDLMTRGFAEYQIQAADDHDPAESDLTRRALASDGVHYYIFNNQSLTPVLQPWGRRTSMADGVLWAVDKTSGDTRWAVDLSEDTILTTDQPELGLLLLVSVTSPRPQPSDRAKVRGLKRETGELVFEHQVPVDSMMRTLKVSSAKPNSLDVTIHRMQISLNGQETLTQSP